MVILIIQVEDFSFSLVDSERDSPIAGMRELGRCSKNSNYLLLPYFLIVIVNFPNGNFDNFDLRPSKCVPCFIEIVCLINVLSFFFLFRYIVQRSNGHSRGTPFAMCLLNFFGERSA